MVVNVSFLLKVYIRHCYTGVTGIKKIWKIKVSILKTEGLVKNKICIYDTYKNTVMTHGPHIYAKASDRAKVIMCEYLHSDHTLTHWKRVLQCCANCECINLPDQ